MSVAAAIESLGGLETVRSNQLLWTEQSQKATEMLLVVRYVVAVTCFAPPCSLLPP